MFFLLEECENKPNGILRYTICSTREQFEKYANNSTATFCDGYEFSSSEELLSWMREFATVPKRC